MRRHLALVYGFALGGRSAASRLNDLHLLEVNTMTWSQPLISGSAPSPRQSAALCIVNATQLLLHGGQNHFVLDDLYVFDLIVRTTNIPRVVV